MIASLAGYDIYLGVHGAQLTNIVYGNDGLVLVEIMNDIWEKVRHLDFRSKHGQRVHPWREGLVSFGFAFAMSERRRGIDHFHAFARSGNNCVRAAL